MNPTLHRPLEIVIGPTIKSSERPVPKELCNMMMRYRPDGSWQHYLEVWVPKELQLILASGDVHSVHVEALEDNGTATRALGYPAAYAVFGVETKAHKRIEFVPPEFLRFKRFCRISGGLACALGVVALALGWAWPGALALAAGAQALSAAQRIPTSPFMVTRYQV